MSFHYRTAVCCVIVGLLPAVAALATEPPAKNRRPDPKRFEQAIVAFERQDRENPPPRGAVVVTGSSSVRMWHDTIRRDLAPLTIIPRGFGGSTMNDLLYYADRVIVRYRPRAVVIYEGDNDTHFGIAPAEIRDTFTQLVAKLHQHDPDMRVYFLAIKPSPRRQAIWPQASHTNRMIKELCRKDSRLFYIDVATPMLDEAGNPKAELFIDDRLHMNRKGYELWTKVVRRVLLKHEQSAK